MRALAQTWPMSNDSCRRRFLYETGVALTAGVLAGCSGGDGSSNGAGTTGDTTTAGEATSPVATDTGTATESMVDTEMTEPSGTQPASRTEATAERSTTGGRTTGTTDGSSITEPAPAAVDEYLSDANFYDGDVVLGGGLIQRDASSRSMPTTNSGSSTTSVPASRSCACAVRGRGCWS